ncbi:MAG TPA: hypothetical protein VK203_05480 [Nostocaceae cyanobacterium]|nr:hypothetical protein [Nostocaceae cyanobacterium]
MPLNQDAQVKTMEPMQEQQRRAAAQEFQESLVQLEGILQTDTTEEEVTPKLHNRHNGNGKISNNAEIIDLAALEDAVADIEQYLAQKTKQI